MDIQLSDSARRWQQTARKFADNYLQPHEIEAELNNGELPTEIAKRNRDRAIELGFPGLDAPTTYSGLGLSIDESFEEAAMDLGGTPVRVVLDITLPLIAPAMAAGWLALRRAEK